MAEESHVIDKCECCSTIYYHPMERCALCGNMILVGMKVDKRTWVRGAAKEKLDARI